MVGGPPAARITQIRRFPDSSPTAAAHQLGGGDVDGGHGRGEISVGSRA
jgi:hypothetical protein